MADNGGQRAGGKVAAKEDSKQTPGRAQGGHMVETWQSGLKADAWLMQGGHLRRTHGGESVETRPKRTQDRRRTKGGHRQGLEEASLSGLKAGTQTEGGHKADT